jgi:hypothetical protein
MNEITVGYATYSTSKEEWGAAAGATIIIK